MIPKHEHLGNLVTTDTEWYRPMLYRIDDDEMASLEQEMRGHDAWFGVIQQGFPCVWGFIKDKPYEMVVEENGEAVTLLVCWGSDTEVRFANGEEIVEQDHWPDNSHLPTEYDETYRCEGVYKTGQRAGMRCENTSWGGYCGKHTKQEVSE